MDARQAILTAEAALSRLSADPIAAFRFSSTAQRRFAEAFHRFREVYLRAGNQAGKTHVAAHYFVALMRGVKKLDGVSMPLLGTPVSGLVLAHGREMAKESVIKAVLRAIGDHPHHLEKNGNAIAAVWVKPDNSRSDEWADWSNMRFFVEDGQSVEGMRLDFAWADEPPKWPLWESIRMRSRANRSFLRGITATPLDKKRWKPLREDFKGCEWPDGGNGKVEIRLSVYDNKALSREHLDQVEEDSKGALQKAKLMGDYIDLTGTNPFDSNGLNLWLSRCRDGDKDTFATGRGNITYETWAEYDPLESYLVVADPSAGIEDEQHEHDPAGVVVVARRKPRLVARYNGYVPAYELGRLARHLCDRYGHALCVWERNSGYGESLFLGLGNYGNVYVEHHLDARGIPLSERIGWTTTATTRGTIIGALQKAIIEDGLFVESRDAVESLGDVVLNRQNRIEAGAGAHDEDMIVLGLAAHLLETMPYRARPQMKGSQQLTKDLGLRLRPTATVDPFSSF